MKRLLATTALVLTASAPAFAESHSMATGDAAAKGGAEMAVEGEGTLTTGDEITAEGTAAAETDAEATADAEGMADTDAEGMAETDMAAGATGDAMFQPNDGFGNNALTASTLIGKYVYNSETDVDGTDVAEADTEWNNIGEVRDIVMSADGKTQSVILDIGGFLGMGEHTVAVSLDKLELVNDSDDTGDFFVVVKASKDQLMEAPEFDMSKISGWTANE